MFYSNVGRLIFTYEKTSNELIEHGTDGIGAVLL